MVPSQAMTKRIPMLLTLSLVSLGCAGTRWTKPGGTGDTLADDQLKCEEYVAMRCIHTRGIWVPICNDKARSQCMTDRGWTEAKE